MPLFEYRCEACAHLEEVLQKHTDPPPEACPACGKSGTMAKAISLTSFQLKGGGWYKDLYASSSSKTEASSGGSATTASSPAGSTSGSATSTSDGASSTPAAKPAETKAAAPAAPASSSTATT